jgi:superfamily II DNA or RNA helicase
MSEAPRQPLLTPGEQVDRKERRKLTKAVLDAKAYVSKRGYILRKDSVSEEELRGIKAELHVKPHVNGDFGAEAEPFDVYLESENKIYLPKRYGLEKVGPVPEECVLTPPGRDIDVSFALSLRDEQRLPVEKVFEAYHTTGGGILSLPCGAGKTIIGCFCIAQLRKKTLIIVHKEFLMNQWKERIEFALPGCRVGILQATRFDRDCDVVIAMLQTLSMKAFPRDAFDDIGHVIIDECHRIPSKVFSRALFKINSPYMLGLSATPHRKDGLTKVLKWFIGDIVYSVKTRSDKNVVYVERFLCESDVREYNEEIVGYNGTAQIATMINNIAGYYHRTYVCMRRVVELLQAHPARQILILSDRKQHLADMEKCARQMGVESIGYYVGGMKEKALKESESKRLLLGTYPMANEGLDIKSLNGLVMASPKSDIIQTVGRILRQKHEGIQPFILDMVDKFSVFENQARKRFELYKKQKYHVVDVSVNIDTHQETRRREYAYHRGSDDSSEEEGDGEEACGGADEEEGGFGRMGFQGDCRAKTVVRRGAKKVVPKAKTVQELTNEILENWKFSDS